MNIFELALQNLTSPPVLAFALGLLATAIRADLRLPEAVYQGLSFYLLLGIGIKGGVALRDAEFSEIALPIAGTIALGVAIPFRTLDKVGAKIGTSSLFPMFNINEIVGSGGLFFSRDAGKNGFGLFADVTNVLDPIMFLDIARKSDIKTLEYNSIIPSSRTEDRIDSEMYKLHRKRKRLQLSR